MIPFPSLAALTRSPHAFVAPATPAVSVGAGRLAKLGEEAAAAAPGARAATLVVDAFLAENGVAARARSALEATGFTVATYGEIAGDPKEAQVDAIAALTRSAKAGVVVAIGGGATIDAGKLAGRVAGAEAPTATYALAAAPLPTGAPTLAVPTTAGTGAEATWTSVVSDAVGRKLWHWGPELVPARALLDAELTRTLPAQMTGWTGLDAFVHALEAATSRRRSPASELYGHEAMRRIARYLPRAVEAPDDLEARGQVLWSACLAGLALNAGGTTLAHCLSHALGSLAPVHHGLATAVGLDVALDWMVGVEGDDGGFDRAAAACGVSRDELPGWWRDFAARCGVRLALPAAFASVSPERLVAEASTAANTPMRANTARSVTDADLARFAAATLARAA